MSADTSVSLWVKAEPFSYGAFHIAPHPRLNFNVSSGLCKDWALI